MASEFLSQEEVDALLRGVSGEPEADPQAGPADGIRPYNLATQERIVRGRMPTLEIINERFARQLRVALFNFMRRSPEISVGPVRVVKYSDFIRNLVVPTNLNVVHVRPLRGSGLFIFDPSLVFAVVDNLFGGDGRFHTRVEGRDFTPTEQRIIQRLLGVVFEEYQKAWAPVHQLNFEYVRSEMHTQFANVATPTEIVVATTFTVELGGAGGDFHICVPYATVEPIRDLLYSSLQADHAEPDKRWLRMLSRQVQSAEVTLVAQLAQTPIKVGRLARLKPGEVIGLDIPDTIVASVDGVPVFECRYGTVNGQYAIRIEKFLTVPRDDNPTGDKHVN
jgi:flagellar motor switch protein FliM